VLSAQLVLHLPVPCNRSSSGMPPQTGSTAQHSRAQQRKQHESEPSTPPEIPNAAVHPLHQIRPAMAVLQLPEKMIRQLQSCAVAGSRSSSPAWCSQHRPRSGHCPAHTSPPRVFVSVYVRSVCACFYPVFQHTHKPCLHSPSGPLPLGLIGPQVPSAWQTREGAGLEV
jgi:hypothetical protein